VSPCRMRLFSTSSSPSATRPGPGRSGHAASPGRPVPDDRPLMPTTRPYRKRPQGSREKFRVEPQLGDLGIPARRP
jgi:hypothetical protein